VSDLQITHRLYPFSPAEAVDFYFNFYGPTNRALNRLDAKNQA
jgi:hypothetical protein